MILLHVLAGVVGFILHLLYQTIDIVLHHLLVSIYIFLRQNIDLPFELLEVSKAFRDIIPFHSLFDLDLRNWRVVAMRLFIQFDS